jgi:hypothetical protein
MYRIRARKSINKKFRWRRFGSSLLCLHTLDPPLSPHQHQWIFFGAYVGGGGGGGWVKIFKNFGFQNFEWGFKSQKKLKSGLQKIGGTPLPSGGWLEFFLSKYFESPPPRHLRCAETFPLVSMGGWAEGIACEDPGAGPPSALAKISFILLILIYLFVKYSFIRVYQKPVHLHSGCSKSQAENWG